MLFENNREALRKRYIDTWHKHLKRLPLEPLEAQILDVILLHPEYHSVLASEEVANRDYPPESGETNPFMHLGFHLGLREQLQTDRPSGIKAIYHSLCTRYQDAHEAEHRMMDCLAQVLWEAQRNAMMPDEKTYLAYLKDL